MRWIILVFIALMGWASLGGRLYLKIIESDCSSLESALQFLSYFTIITTLLVSIYCSWQLFHIVKVSHSKLEKPEALTALTVFSLVVGIVYHMVQKPLWNPEGIDLVIDTVHHTIIPIATLALWLFTRHEEPIRIKRLLIWLIYPILYGSFVLIRGSFSNFYPYSFMNVETLGVTRVFINLVGVILLITTFLFIFYLTARKWKKSRP